MSPGSRVVNQQFTLVTAPVQSAGHNYSRRAHGVDKGPWHVRYTHVRVEPHSKRPSRMRARVSYGHQVGFSKDHGTCDAPTCGSSHIAKDLAEREPGWAMAIFLCKGQFQHFSQALCFGPFVQRVSQTVHQNLFLTDWTSSRLISAPHLWRSSSSGKSETACPPLWSLSTMRACRLEYHQKSGYCYLSVIIQIQPGSATLSAHVYNYYT